MRSYTFQCLRVMQICSWEQAYILDHPMSHCETHLHTSLMNRNVMIALVFHQWLEGIGLGAMVSIADFRAWKGERENEEITLLPLLLTSLETHICRKALACPCVLHDWIGFLRQGATTLLLGRMSKLYSTLRRHSPHHRVQSHSPCGHCHRHWDRHII